MPFFISRLHKQHWGHCLFPFAGCVLSSFRGWHVPYPSLPHPANYAIFLLLFCLLWFCFLKTFESYLSKSLNFLKSSQTKIPHYPRRLHPSSSCPSPTHFLLELDTLSAEKYNIHWENTLLCPAGVPKGWIRCALSVNGQDLMGENVTADTSTNNTRLILSYTSVAARKAAKTTYTTMISEC